MKYYYANASNQPSGPLTLDELRALLARDEITPATNVIAVGETTWRPLYTVLAANVAATPSASTNPTTSPPPPAPPPPAAAKFDATSLSKAPTLLAEIVGRFLGFSRRLLEASRLQSLFAKAGNLAQLLVVVGAVLVLIAGIVSAIRYDSFAIFLSSLIAVALLAVLQYVAKRLLEACARSLRNSPTRVGSVAVLDCFALLFLLSGLGVLVQSIVTAIRYEFFAPVIPGAVIFVILVALAGVALHPSLANVEETPSSAGEEAIGLMSFFAKAWLALQPLLFCVYAAAGVLVVLLALFNADTRVELPLIQGFVETLPLSSAEGGLFGGALIAAACLVPFFSYLGFLLYYLTLDVLNAVLSIPGKLDQLRR